MLHSLTRRSRRIAFTLLELVVVIMILATLAGLVIPQVSMLGRSSDMAATSKNASDTANNLGLYFVLQKRFPQGMDTLLVNDAGTYEIYRPEEQDGTPLTSGSGATQVRGLPVSGPSLYQNLVATNLATLDASAPPGADGYRRSLNRTGIDWFYDHDETVIDSNASGIVRRPVTGNLSNSDPEYWVAVVTPGSAVAQKLLPATNGVPPVNSVVVALGVGARSSHLGKTAMNAPIYPGCDGKYYGRYVAFFQLYISGERATLLGVTDSYGRSVDYGIQQFNQSLPDDSRQG